MGQIYVLYSTIDGAPFYVGRTTQHASARLRQHVNLAGDHRIGTQPVHNRIRGIWKAGGNVDFIVAKNVEPRTDLRFWEWELINSLPGLVNVQLQREPNPETRWARLVLRRCRSCAGDVVENVQGYHGITYWCWHDAFSARVVHHSPNRYCRMRYADGRSLDLDWVFRGEHPVFFANVESAIDARDTWYELARKVYGESLFGEPMDAAPPRDAAGKAAARFGR